METMSNLASIATLVLFLVYIVGRTMTVTAQRHGYKDVVDIYLNDDRVRHKVVQEFSDEASSSENLYITPEDFGYRWVKVYEYKEDFSAVKKKPIKVCGKVLPHTSFRLNAIISCAGPRYKIKFRRSDFTIGEMDVCYNGKNGVQEEMIITRYTLLGWIYYFCK